MEKKYLTLGDLRALDLPDETPILSITEAGAYGAVEVHQTFVSQDELETESEIEFMEKEATEDCSVLAIYFE